MSGSHLLSHAVARIVPSAGKVLTVVFGMGTGVAPPRIATGQVYHFLINRERRDLRICESSAAPFESDAPASALTTQQKCIPYFIL